MLQFLDSMPSAARMLLEMTGHALLLAAVVWLVIRLFGKALHPAWRFALWSLVAIRLCLPMVPESPLSLMAMLPSWQSGLPYERAPNQVSPSRTSYELGSEARMAAEHDQQSQAPPTGMSAESLIPLNAGVPNSQQDIELASDRPVTPEADAEFATPLTGKPPVVGAAALTYGVLIAIWLITMALIVLRRLLMYVRLKKAIAAWRKCQRAEVLSRFSRCATECNVRTNIALLISEDDVGPATVGIWNPRVIIPESLLDGLSGEELDAVFRHELWHIRRRDTAWDLAMNLMTAIHWFNPAIWLARRQMRHERELACDAAVLRHSSRRDATNYGKLLVRLAARAPVSTSPLPAMVNSGQFTNLEQRIAMIISRKRWSRTSQLFSSLLLLTCALAGLTAAQSGHARSAAQVPFTPSTSPGDSETTPAETSDIQSETISQQSQPPAQGDRVDAFGDPLPEGALLRMGTIRLRQSGSVQAVAYSPDGKILATGGADQPIYLWDAATGAPITEFRAKIDTGFTRGIAFSPNGKKLAAVGDRGVVTLWDIASAAEEWTTSNHKDRVVAVAFAPDGVTLASAGGDGTVRLWDAATGTELRVIDTQARSPIAHAIAFSPDGNLLASGSVKAIRIYDLKQGGEPAVIPNAHGRQTVTLSFTPDGSELISGGSSAVKVRTDDQGKRMGSSFAETKIWSLQEKSLVQELGTPDEQSNSSAVAISQDGRSLVSVQANRIQIWDLAKRELVRTISDYRNSYGTFTHGVAIAPDGKSFAVVSGNHSVLLWSLETGQPILPFTESHQSRVEALAWSNDGSMVASGANDGSIIIWDAMTGKPIRNVPFGSGRAAGVQALAFSADGRSIAAGGYDLGDAQNEGVIKIVNLADGGVVWSARIKSRVTSLCYTPDGEQIVASTGLASSIPGRDQSPLLYAWNATTGAEARSWEATTARSLQVACSADGKFLHVLDEVGVISNWSLPGFEKTAAVNLKEGGRAGLSSIVLAKDGKFAAMSERFTDSLILADTATGKELRRIIVENSKGSKLAFSPDGQLLASGSIGIVITLEKRYDRRIHVWNVSTGEFAGKFDPGGPAVTSIEFSPEGRRLLTGMEDGTLLMWDVANTTSK